MTRRKAKQKIKEFFNCNNKEANEIEMSCFHYSWCDYRHEVNRLNIIEWNETLFNKIYDKHINSAIQTPSE